MNHARPRPRPLPVELTDAIATALADLDAARADLARLTVPGAPASSLAQRRHAYARTSTAYETAEALLRRATTAARPGGYRQWRTWRHRLSVLTAAKVTHLFAETDAAVRGLGSVQALDTGMSKPAIGDHQHGTLADPGAQPSYGLDLDAALTSSSR